MVLALTFAAFFGTTGNPLKRATALIEVGDTEIDGQTLTREFNRQVKQISAMLRQTLTSEQARQFGLLDNTISQLVTRAVVGETARKAGLVASDALVARAIMENPQFRPAGAAFDRFTFDNFLRLEGLTEATFAEQVRQDLVQQQLVSAATAGAAVPRSVVDTLYRYRAEKRVADRKSVV